MDFDSLLVNHIGEFGRAQKIILLFVCLAEFPFVINNLGIVFLAGVPEHWCLIPELDHHNLSSDIFKNFSIPLEEKDGQMIYSSCWRYEQNFSRFTKEEIHDILSNGSQSTWRTTQCSLGWEYDQSIYTSTIVTEWDLVCDRSWYRATTSSVYMSGLMVGVLVMSSVSDLWGRRPAVLLSLVLGHVANLAVMFSPNIIVFIILRFFVAIFTIGLYTCTYILCLETVGPSWRLHASQVFMYVYVVPNMGVAGLAYAIRDWFFLQLAFALCCLITLVNVLIPESPRWLYTLKKNDEANAIIRKMAKINRVKIPDTMDVNIENRKKGYIWDLVKTPRLRLRSVNLFFNWFVISLVYYGLSLNTSNLGGDHFLNYFISAIVALPATLLAHITVVFLGRKWPLAASLWLGGVALLCTLAVPKDLNWVTILLSMIGKFGISWSFTILYVFTAELYPTVIRNTAVGTCSFFARIGGIVAPYIILLSDISKYIPLVSFGAVSVLAGILALLLPETKGRNLAETIADGENFGSKNPEISNTLTTDIGYSDAAVINPSVDTEITTL